MAKKSKAGVKEVTETDALALIDGIVAESLDKVAQKITASLDSEIGDSLTSFTDKMTKETASIYGDYYQSVLNQNLFMMPPGTRFFRQQGGSASLIVEQQPMVRTLKYYEHIQCRENSKLVAGPIALPYCYFIFDFAVSNSTSGGDVIFRVSAVKSGWSKTPVKSMSDRIRPPILTNVDSGLNICFGDNQHPQTTNLTQFVDEYLRIFWESPFGADYNTELVAMKNLEPNYFGDAEKYGGNYSFDDWSASCVENPSYLMSESSYWMTDNISSHILSDMVCVSQGAQLVDVVKRALQDSIKRNSWELSQGVKEYISGLDIREFRKKKGDLRSVRKFMEKCVEDSTEELRKMYGSDIQQILLDIEKKQEKLVLDILDGQKVERSDQPLVAGGVELTNPW